MARIREIKKLKVARVVTAPEVVIFHLRNFLDDFENEYDLEIIGDSVSQFSKRWPKVKFTDVAIPRKIKPMKDLTALIHLVLVLRRGAFDIVHSIAPKAALLAPLAGFLVQVPVRIHTFTGQIWANKKGLKKRIFITFDKLTVKLCTHCFTDSFSQSEFLFQHGIQRDGKPLPVLGDGSLAGVNLKQFNRDEKDDRRRRIRRELKLDDEQIVFSFIGRKCRDKGVFELLSAFKSLLAVAPNARLLLVGPNDEANFQTTFDAEYSSIPEIISVGFTSRPEDYLAASDVFCLPSYREGFGTIVIEAAAMQVATIGTRIPGLIDAIVDGESGLLVEKADVESLRAAMLLLASDAPRRSRLALNAFERATSKFAAQRIFSLLSKTYREAFESLNFQENSRC